MPESRDFVFEFVFSLYRFSWSSCDSASASALDSGFRRNDGDGQFRERETFSTAPRRLRFKTFFVLRIAATLGRGRGVHETQGDENASDELGRTAGEGAVPGGGSGPRERKALHDQLHPRERREFHAKAPPRGGADFLPHQRLRPGAGGRSRFSASSAAPPGCRRATTRWRC